MTVSLNHMQIGQKCKSPGCSRGFCVEGEKGSLSFVGQTQSRPAQKQCLVVGRKVLQLRAAAPPHPGARIPNPPNGGAGI
jgi:hypothetical protein